MRWGQGRSAQLFFTIEILQSAGPDEPAFGRTHEPFLAIGIITRFADRIIGNYIKNQLLRAVVGELMRFSRFEQERVPGHDLARAFLVPNGAFAGNDMIKFPLRAVRMIWVGGLTRGDAADLHVERMAFAQVGGGRFASQGFGYLFAGTDKFALGRG